MLCEEVKYYMKDFAHGYLIDEMRKHIGDHLEGCASCRRELEQIITENVISNKYKSEKQYHRYGPERYVMNSMLGSRGGDENHSLFRVDDRGVFNGADNLKKDPAGDSSNQRSKWLELFGMIMFLLVTSLVVVMYFYRQPGRYWTAEKIDGKPDIGGKALSEYGRLNKGEWLTTDGESRALLKVGAIGQIDVNGGTSVRLLDANPADNRIYMKEGSIQTTIWSNFGVFFVQTPSGTVTDRGGIFSLKVDTRGANVLHVSSGKAGIEYDGLSTVVPAGAACESLPSSGPGIPYFEDSSPGLINAIHIYDSDNKDPAVQNSIIKSSSKKDLLTLWYLLRRSGKTERGRIFDRINSLTQLSSNITRSGIMNGNKTMMKNLLNDIGYDGYPI